jgi:PKD repeat protein
VAIFDSTKVQAGFTWLPLEPCTNDSVRFTNTSLNAGTYTWNFGDGSTSTAKNPVKVYSTAGNYPVLLIATGSSGKDSLAQTITVQAAPAATITAGGATTFCQGGSVTLTASAGASYNWSNVQTTQAITASNAANYTVTVTGSDGCSAASSPKTVTVNALPTAKITASGALTFCLGDSVTLTATAGTGYKYKWSSKQTAQSIEVAASGSYKVTVTTASGCSAVSSAEKVTTEKLPTATITANGPVTFCTGSVKLTANSGSGYSYKWSNGATAKAITVSAAGEYIVTVTNKTDCSFASSPEVVTINCGNEAQTLADKSDINANQNTLTSTGNTEFLASVYPNPYIGVFRLKLQSASMDNLNIKIFDVNGRVLEERINIAFENDITLGEGYASGFYMVQIEQGSVTKYLPVVKSE